MLCQAIAVHHYAAPTLHKSLPYRYHTLHHKKYRLIGYLAPIKVIDAAILWVVITETDRPISTFWHWYVCSQNILCNIKIKDLFVLGYFDDFTTIVEYWLLDHITNAYFAFC